MSLARIACIVCSGICLIVGLLGIIMIAYWHHVSGNWSDGHISFWMMIGMPSTIAIFAFMRLSEFFKS